MNPSFEGDKFELANLAINVYINTF